MCCHFRRKRRQRNLSLGMQDRTGAQYRGGPRWLDWTRHTRFERLFVLVPLFLIPWLLDVNRVQSSQLAHSTFSRSDEPGSPSLQHKAVRTEGPRPVSLPPYPSDRCRIIREQQMEAGLRALGHSYFGGGGLGGFAAARATRLRRQRQRRMAAFCSREWQGIPPTSPLHFLPLRRVCVSDVPPHARKRFCSRC